MCSRSTSGFDELIALPPQAVAGDLVVAGGERGDRLGVAGQRHRDPEHRERQPAPVEHPQHAPQPGARTVLVERLQAHVPVRKCLRANDFGQERLGSRVAVQDVVLGTLLVVEDELHRDVGATGPARVGRVGARSRSCRAGSRPSARSWCGLSQRTGFRRRDCGQDQLMPTLLWFRRDLRLHDLPPLLDAAQADGEVLACYVLDPRLRASAGPRRLQYLYDSLRELRDGLDGRLLVTRGRPETRIPALVKEIGATSVHVSGDFSPFGVRRDKAVREALGDVPLEESGSPYLVSPGRVTKGDGTPYKVFTPFYAAWREHGWRAPAKTGPKSATWIDPADVGGGCRHPQRRRRTRPARRRDRRAQGVEDVRRVQAERLRPTTATGPTSTASAGCRRTSSSAPSTPAPWRPTSAAARARRPICASWRSATSTPACCYEWPDSAWWNWNKSFDSHRGRRGPRRASKRFEAWKAGRTGFPIVDAGHASTGRDRLHAQPGADDRRVVPGQGSAPAVAVGRAVVPRAAGRRRHGQQSARLAVGGGLRHRRGAVLPGVQPEDAGARSSIPTAPTCGAGCRSSAATTIRSRSSTTPRSASRRCGGTSKIGYLRSEPAVDGQRDTGQVPARRAAQIHHRVADRPPAPPVERPTAAAVRLPKPRCSATTRPVASL